LTARTTFDAATIDVGAYGSNEADAIAGQWAAAFPGLAGTSYVTASENLTPPTIGVTVGSIPWLPDVYTRQRNAFLRVMCRDLPAVPRKTCQHTAPGSAGGTGTATPRAELISGHRSGHELASTRASAARSGARTDQKVGGSNPFGRTSLTRGLTCVYTPLSAAVRVIPTHVVPTAIPSGPPQPRWWGQPGPGHRSTPEDGGGVALDLGEKIVDSG
jgi:hypothetical protein